MSYSSRWISALKARPDLLNSLTGCLLFAGSDGFAQVLEGKGKEGGEEFSHHRFLTSGVLGVFFGGYVYPRAYARLDHIWPGSSWRQVIKKSLVEIATVGIFVNSISIAARGMLVGRSTQDVLPHVADEMPHVTINDFRVWFPYNLVAFGFIPPLIRPSTTALMEASWQTYISIRSHAYVEPHLEAPHLPLLA